MPVDRACKRAQTHTHTHKLGAMEQASQAEEQACLFDPSLQCTHARTLNSPSSRRMEGVRGMRSLEASVSILLSSMTVFIDSIHSASMSPSSTIHCAGSTRAHTHGQRGLRELREVHTRTHAHARAHPCSSSCGGRQGGGLCRMQALEDASLQLHGRSQPRGPAWLSECTPPLWHMHACPRLAAPASICMCLCLFVYACCVLCVMHLCMRECACACASS